MEKFRFSMFLRKLFSLPDPGSSFEKAESVVETNFGHRSEASRKENALAKNRNINEQKKIKPVFFPFIFFELGSPRPTLEHSHTRAFFHWPRRPKVMPLHLH